MTNKVRDSTTGIEYTLRDSISIGDWYSLPMPLDGNPKAPQIQMIQAIIKEPRLTFEEVLKLDFTIMNDIIALRPNVFGSKKKKESDLGE